MKSSLPDATVSHSIRSPGWDALLLAVLVFAQLRIGSLAEPFALPFLRQDVLRHPLLETAATEEDRGDGRASSLAR
ncbi:MAG: hypothetical protein KF893_21195 [Caldilineaceae bacterium]|nr:hypothetical protein [Caldilineaceae bacterium]